MLDLLYPPSCVLCRAPLGVLDDLDDTAPSLCPPCRTTLPGVGRPGCVVCGAGLPGAYDAVVTCAACRRFPPAFTAARAPWRYAGAAEALIRQFKYHRHWRLGCWMAREMTACALATLPSDRCDAVLPVPPYWFKRHLQGASPSGALAAEVSRRLDRPSLRHALTRRRWTRTQTQLSWAARQRNVRDAFWSDARQVRGQTLLLVDDVLTSGATASACARSLREAGAHAVYVLTAARTPLA